MGINITKHTSTCNTTSCSRIPKYIIIHYTAGTSSKSGTAKSTAQYFAKSTSKASADFIVDDGSIIQYNPDPKKYYCWSVGGSKYKSMSTSLGGKYYGIVKNSNCINIEMCSNKKNKNTLNASDTDWYITDATKNNAIELVKYLMKLYDISISNVLMHHHITGKICPNPFCVNESALTQWFDFKNRLSSDTNSYTSSDLPPAPTISSQDNKIYRVRKSWADASSQIGAFSSLENAKSACKDGYSVFDGNGNIVYNKSEKQINNSATTSNTYTYKDFVKDVQAAIGAKADGIAGNETLSKTITVSMSKNSRHSVVKPIQKYLNYLGYNCGEPDGIAGTKFDNAVKAFQKANGCIADGEITSRMSTWKKLLKLS